MGKGDPKRKGRWVAFQRQVLVDHLGGRCNHCGSVEDLEFDHILERDRQWEPSQVGATRRLLLYACDIAKGKIQLLCKKCHDDKTRNYKLQKEIPFLIEPF